MRPTTRRELVAAATATALTAAVPPAYGKRLLSRRARVGPGSFGDGVATGEPATNAVTFWSRLRTERPRSGARLIIATDERMRDTVATAVVPTGRSISHTLKARVGGLDPHTEYFYVWQSGTHVSEIGRTRTRPPAGSAVPLRIAFSSCQRYSSGYFSAHAHAAAEDLDAYVFLGDYIYERVRPGVFPGRDEPFNANDLGSYRRKYVQYRADPGLRELHRLHPALHVWDDHEVENNYSDNRPAPALLQRAAAYRAAFEWLPRVVEPRDRHRVYRRLPWGTIGELFLLDARQYRTGDGDGQPRRILGEAQMAWLIDGLKTSRARWKIIAQQVIVAQDPYGDGRPNPDMWDGYPEDRARLLGEIERNGIQNVVFLTGDAHVFACNLLSTDFGAVGDGTRRPASAVEYVGGSVTTEGFDRAEPEVQANAPWTRQYNGRDHGYALLAMDDTQLVTEYRRSDISQPAGATQTFERFTQQAGFAQVARESIAPPPAPPPPPT